jgi:hypothetical protein
MEFTLDELRQMASRAGLNLSQEELLKLLPGVTRSHKQVAELRELLQPTAAPSGTFSATQLQKS